MKARTALLELFKESGEWRSFFRSCCETSASRLRSRAWQFRVKLKERGYGFPTEEVEDALLGLARELLPDTAAANWDTKWAHALCKDALARLANAYTELSAREKGALDRERLLPDEKTLEKIARYEVHLSRGIYKALHELEALQARRCGGGVRRANGGRREEHRKVPCCAHHAIADNFAHSISASELKHKLRACADRDVIAPVWNADTDARSCGELPSFPSEKERARARDPTIPP